MVNKSKRTKRTRKSTPHKKGGSAAILGLSFALGAPAGASSYYLFKKRSGVSAPVLPPSPAPFLPPSLPPALKDETPPPPPPRDDGVVPYAPSALELQEQRQRLKPLQQELGMSTPTFDSLMAKIGLTEDDLKDEAVCTEKINKSSLPNAEKEMLCDGIHQCFFQNDECRSQSGALSSRGRIVAGTYGGGRRKSRSRSRRTRSRSRRSRHTRSRSRRSRSRRSRNRRRRTRSHRSRRH